MRAVLELTACGRWHITMPAIVAKSIAILSDAGLGMAMFSLGEYVAAPCSDFRLRPHTPYCSCRAVWPCTRQPASPSWPASS
jgi:hypothetical protein